jgi:hypothetical protein
MFVFEQSVKRKASLPVEENLRSDCSVNCLWPSEGLWHLYLLKHHKCWIKQVYKKLHLWRFCASMTFAIHHPSGRENRMIVRVMFEFKLKKLSQHAITCCQGRTSSGTRLVPKVPYNCSATFVSIPWPSNLYCVTRGVFSSIKHRRRIYCSNSSVNTVYCSFLQLPCKLFQYFMSLNNYTAPYERIECQ